MEHEAATDLTVAAMQFRGIRRVGIGRRNGDPGNGIDTNSDPPHVADTLEANVSRLQIAPEEQERVMVKYLWASMMVDHARQLSQVEDIRLPVCGRDGRKKRIGRKLRVAWEHDPQVGSDCRDAPSTFACNRFRLVA